LAEANANTLMSASSLSKEADFKRIPIPATRVFGFVGLCLLPVILAFGLSRQLLRFTLDDATFSQVPLIPLVSTFLIYQDRKSIFSGLPSGVGLSGLPALFGVLLALLLRFNAISLGPSNRACGFALALMLTWIGSFGLFFGKDAFKAARFPLFFLIFAIPIPDPPLSRIISWLQYGSADVAEGFFRMAGVPYLRHDLIFALPGVSIRVAEECSGIRSTLALLITTVLASYLFLKDAWRRVALCLSVIPLAIFKNGLRIMALSTLAIYVDPGFLYGNLHHHGGVVFFAIALMVMGLFFLWLQKGERRAEARRGQPSVEPALAKPHS
jgi:exosortase